MNTITGTTRTTTTAIIALVDPDAPAKAPTTKPRFGFIPVSRYDHVRSPDLTDVVLDEAIWFTEHGMVVVDLLRLGEFRSYMACSGLVVPREGLYRMVGTSDLSWEHLKSIVETRR